LAQNQAPRPIQPEPPCPLLLDWNEYPAKAGEVNRHIAWYTSPYPWSHSVCWMPGWWTSLRKSAPMYGKR